MATLFEDFLEYCEEDNPSLAQNVLVWLADFFDLKNRQAPLHEDEVNWISQNMSNGLQMKVFGTTLDDYLGESKAASKRGEIKKTSGGVKLKLKLKEFIRWRFGDEDDSTTLGNDVIDTLMSDGKYEITAVDIAKASGYIPLHLVKNFKDVPKDELDESGKEIVSPEHFDYEIE